MNLVGMDEAACMEETMRKGQFTLDDFLDQNGKDDRREPMACYGVLSEERVALTGKCRGDQRQTKEEARSLWSC